MREKRQSDIVIGVEEVIREAREVDILVKCYGCGTPTNLCTFSNLHVPSFLMQHVDWIRCTCCMGTVPALSLFFEKGCEEKDISCSPHS